MSVPATTVNKLCLSGLAAIAQAAQQVQLGYRRVVAAGGMESMSGAPHLSRDTRRGLRYGAGAPLEDALDSDALVCGFDGLSMGAATDKYQARQRRDQPRGPGRVRRRVAGMGGGGGQGGPALLRRDAAGRDDAVGVGDLDLIEINVAFAGVALASLRDLGVAKDRDGPGEAVQDRLAGQAGVEHSPGG
jgi:acetyl-CoA acetyltransferase